MWHGVSPPEGTRTRLVTPLRSEVLQHYRNWKQCQYLPLGSGAEYASGITVYMSPGFTEIYGIVSHGATESSFGETEYEEDKCEKTWHLPGVPIHFPLSRREYLVSAWLHLRPRFDDLNGMLAVRSTLVWTKSSC